MAINVGDLVRITDRMYHYSEWAHMFRQMGFRSDEERNNPYQNGDVLRVFAIQPHPITEGITLYGLKHPTNRLGTQILINQRGIEYVFPGNWHIRVTPENNEMLGNWRQAGSIDGLEGIILSEHRGSRGYWMAGDMDIPDHCRTEITTEQFRQYVLNQTPTNMPTQTTPEQLYQEATNAMNLQPGDIVRVTQRWASNSRGWNNSWSEDMDNYIGSGEYVVSSVTDGNYGVMLRDCPFNFPIYSLEIVRRAGDHIPRPQPTSNLENEQEEAVVTTTEKVICITDKWNYVNLGEVYEVVKRDDYYTYVKDSVGGESRYAHHYFEEWVDAETKAKRDSFKALFGEHSKTMFNNAPDEIQKLMSKLYPKLYKYNGWLKLKKEPDQESKWLFEGLGIRLITEEDTTNEKFLGTMRFDPMNFTLDTFNHQGYTYIRFKQNI